MHVLIAGAGIGGLCLARGLRRAGVSCAVYERSPEITLAGYMLNMRPEGGGALRDCLPDRLYDLYVATSRHAPRRDLIVFLDHHGTEVGTMPHLGPPNDPVTPHTTVNRRTLYQILLSGIEDAVHFGQEVTGYHHEGGEVLLEISGGRSARGTVLVGADGINSVVRRQFLPEVDIVPLIEHVLLSKAPLTTELASALPSAFSDSFVMIRDPAGNHMATGLFQPRQDVIDVATRIAPEVALDPVEDYATVILEPVGLDLGNEDFFTAPSPFLHRLMRRMVEDWHPALRLLVDSVDPASIAPGTIRMVRPVSPWQTGNVTLIGDAVHAMPPMYGHGANSALRDASALATALAMASNGDLTLHEAVARYETDMRARTYPLLEEALASPTLTGGITR